MTDRAERLKQDAMEFYDLLFNRCRPREAAERFIGMEYAGMDIFRFDGSDKVVEHWDVLQVVPDKTAHNNGMF